MTDADSTRRREAAAEGERIRRQARWVSSWFAFGSAYLHARAGSPAGRAESTLCVLRSSVVEISGTHATAVVDSDAFQSVRRSLGEGRRPQVSGIATVRRL